MNTLSVKLPRELFLRLANEARRRNIDCSTLVRENLDRTLGNGAETNAQSCAELARELVGSVASGRTNLATNRELLQQAVLGDSISARPSGSP